MDTNEYVQEKKENIFSKISNFIKKLFRPKQALPSPETLSDELSGVENASTATEKKSDFVKEIKLEPRHEDPALLDLQKKFESNQIQLTELSDEELHNLNELYQRQIEDLKKQLDNTKTEISISSYRIESYSTN